MKIKSGILLFVFAIISACNSTSGQQKKINASLFDEKLTSTAGAQLIDVRTPEEYIGGHIKGSFNLNWNSNEFERMAAALDKEKPLFVYCLSGGRSSSAASKLSSMGFKEIYELEGGIMAWNNAGKATEKTSTSTSSNSKSLTIEEFKKITTSNKLVLVDFNAVWCAPCKKLAPILEEISNENKNTMELIKVDADNNKEIVSALQIEALPTLVLYKNSEMVWRSIGFMNKAEILEVLKKYTN